MKVKLDVFEDLWRKGVKSLTELNQGTRIHFRTTYKKLKTAYPKARNRMSTLMMALAEHLGVSYKKFLEHSDQNKINIFWEDGLGSRDEIQLEPIYPVYRQDTDVEGNKYHRKDDLIVLDDGNNYKVSYERGIVDWEKTRKKYKDSKVVSSGSSGSPFKIYYRKNQVSQGVNVVYLGRTLNTSLFSEIWSDKNRHNDFNDFYGEIVINHPEFETVNNKTEINHNGDLWQDLIGDLNSGEQFRPIRYGKKKKESDIKVKLKSVLESDAMTERVDKEKSTSADVNIDLLRVMDSGEELIYEVKRGRAKLLDVYQCIMYWDTYKKIESANPTKAILVGKSISDDAKNVLEEWNARKDVVGDPYKIIFQTLDELGVEE